jgi:Fe-S-cluster containining protein
LNYSCICCGTCCQKYQPWLTPDEVTEIAGKLDITPQKFLTEYTDPRWPGTESFLLVHVNDACIFLKTTPDTKLKICGIHSFKPASCWAWAAGSHKSECQKGLKQLFDISVDATCQLLATEEQIKKLADRVKMIDRL